MRTQAVLDQQVDQTTMLSSPRGLRARAVAARSSSRLGVRLIGIAIIAMLLVPMVLSLGAQPASADEDEDIENYSLYNLASNVANYFGAVNSPGELDGIDNITSVYGSWAPVTQNPGTAGGLLGYADADFSLFNISGWLHSGVTGSAQEMSFDSLYTLNETRGGVYDGMVDYAHFGAANLELGFDSMESGIMGQIVNVLGGGILLVLYSLAIAVSMLFGAVISLLKILNPFAWFTGIWSGITNYVEVPGYVTGLIEWVNSWWSVITDLSWSVLLPIFIAVTLLSFLVLQKGKRGGLVKRLIAWMAFLVLGLPMIGSLYTSVLNSFDDALGQHANSSRVVLTTFVDFENWAMNERLAIPSEATIGWEDGRPSGVSVLNARNSALAINIQSHDSLSGMSVMPGGDGISAEESWNQGNQGMEYVDSDGEGLSPSSEVMTVYGILTRFTFSSEVNASDFETNIKAQIAALGDDQADNDTKRAWFQGTYATSDIGEFGTNPTPDVHPLLSTYGAGLQSSNPGGTTTTFTTAGGADGCGSQVLRSGAPVQCNLSVLAMYNYLNSSFDNHTVSMFSSNKIMSGLSRESHASVSMVGTGFTSVGYWLNSSALLMSFVVIGFGYALGMLAGSVRRMTILVGSIPFAALGAMNSLAKVISYSVMLILEILLTLFLYQFATAILTALPDIFIAPLEHWSNRADGTGSAAGASFRSLLRDVMSIISALVIFFVTFHLLKARSKMMKAIDEPITKFTEKFLSTNSAPMGGGGLGSSIGRGVGAGAGMLAASRLGDRRDNTVTNSSGAANTKGPGARGAGAQTAGGPGGQPSAGGANDANKRLSAGGLRSMGTGGPGEQPDGPLGLPAGPDGGTGGSSSVGGPGEPDGGPGVGGTSGAAGPDGAAGETAVEDKGSPLQLTGGSPGNAREARAAAQRVSQQGGLSNLGYSTGGTRAKGAGTGKGLDLTGNQAPAHRLSGQNQTGSGTTTGGTSSRGANPLAQQGVPGTRPRSAAAVQAAAAQRLVPAGGASAAGAQTVGATRSAARPAQVVSQSAAPVVQAAGRPAAARPAPAAPAAQAAPAQRVSAGATTAPRPQAPAPSAPRPAGGSGSGGTGGSNGSSRPAVVQAGRVEVRTVPSGSSGRGPRVAQQAQSTRAAAASARSATGGGGGTERTGGESRRAGRRRRKTERRDRSGDTE